MEERRGSSFDLFTAQTIKMFRGKQGFPSLVRWRMSLKIAKNGEIPTPPATKIRFSYLKNQMVKLVLKIEDDIKLKSLISSKF